ncbi:ZIP family metal transporter [Halosimplex sp. TS25]|uniref:ZIP family metal transporter n=1 Tax=Halosimplex rarum TaxID=3396619 RepID=UPI0039E784DF
MSINEASGVNNSAGRLSLAGGAGVVALLALSVVAVVTDLWKVFIIGWVAFAAMVAGAYLGGRADATDPQRLVWGYGLASGAMVTSAAMFLVPQAINIGRAAGAVQIGGIGIALGIVVGYSGHVVGHRLTHRDLPMDVTTAQITAHALSAGLIIGLVYGSMPTLGLLLGLAIVSHKGPAGYAAARRLRRNGKPVSALLLPAAGVGITAIPSASLPVPEVAALNAVVFGFAAGIFLHIAMDFLPVCEAGSEIDQVCSLHEESHELLDQLRVHAVGSTVVGAVAVVVAWFVVAP